jgi:cyanate permease
MPSTSQRSSNSRTLIWLLFCVLFVLHQDFWWWGDESIVLGFMPIGLAWHVGFSMAAALLWLAALKWAWPSEVEEWANEPEEAP